jgi:hypothetical protein
MSFRLSGLNSDFSFISTEKEVELNPDPVIYQIDAFLVGVLTNKILAVNKA